MSTAAPPRDMTVGTPWIGYAERRNFVDLPVPGVRYVRVRDRFALLHALRTRLGRARDEAVRFRHAPPSRPSVDLLHFFNSVSSGRTPWVVTFETTVPRGRVPDDLARRLVDSEACRRLIALSDCARRLQIERWERLYGDGASIARRSEVLHPPQAPMVGGPGDKPDPADGLRFVFVGRHFFRKGGRPLVAAFEELLGRGADVRLHVISTLEHGDRWSATTRADADAARAFVARHGDRVTLQAGAPNAAVLEALRSAHVLLLPTLAETYGYSVLEGQAAGCACLTTNLRALPEINTAATGWTIPLPLTGRLSVRLKTDDERAAAEHAIRTGLVAAIEEMLADPAEVLRRGSAALERIRTDHDPQRAADRLAEIYAAALAR